jgi:hypothetical protein
MKASWTLRVDWIRMTSPMTLRHTNAPYRTFRVFPSIFQETINSELQTRFFNQTIIQKTPKTLQLAGFFVAGNRKEMQARRGSSCSEAYIVLSTQRQNCN